MKLLDQEVKRTEKEHHSNTTALVCELEKVMERRTNQFRELLNKHDRNQEENISLGKM